MTRHMKPLVVSSDGNGRLYTDRISKAFSSALPLSLSLIQPRLLVAKTKRLYRYWGVLRGARMCVGCVYSGPPSTADHTIFHCSPTGGRPTLRLQNTSVPAFLFRTHTSTTPFPFVNLARHSVPGLLRGEAQNSMHALYKALCYLPSKYQHETGRGGTVERLTPLLNGQNC